MMSPGMQKLNSHLMNTESPSTGIMKKKPQFFGVWFLLLGLGFLWFFFHLKPRNRGQNRDFCSTAENFGTCTNAS